jgi:hypothetical protein
MMTKTLEVFRTYEETIRAEYRGRITQYVVIDAKFGNVIQSNLHCKSDEYDDLLAEAREFLKRDRRNQIRRTNRKTFAPIRGPLGPT